jgi:hypothetical protein
MESQAHGRSIPEHSGVGGDIPVEGEYEEDELGRLREEAELLRRQLSEVVERLDQFSR